MRIMKILCGLLIILLSTSVKAEKFRANEIKFGRPNTSKDKTIYYGANGLHRFNETSGKFEMSTNGGGTWQEVQAVGGFADTFLSNLIAPTAVNVPLLPASGSSIDMGSLLLPWGDMMVGYDTNSHFIVVDPATNVSALEIGATTAFNGNSWGINAPVNNNRLWLSLRTANNPAGPSNGISIETGDATLAGDSGDILIKTGEENATGGARGEVLFNSSIVDFQNVSTVDFSGVTVLGIAGGGGGILWSTPVNADILPSASNIYNLGASNNFYVTVNGSTGKFANLDNLTGVPINVLQNLTMTGRDITGLNAITVDSINETTASAGITFNGVLLKNALDPVSAQDVATKNYVDTEIALAVGFDPSAISIPLLPSTDNTIGVGSVSKRWAEGYFTSIKSIQTIESFNTTPLSVKTINQGAGLSANLNLESGSSNLAGGGGNILIKTGDNAIGESGSVTIQSGSAGTTRGEISLNGSQVNANTTKIINVVDPVALQDVATKNYVDVAISGVGVGGSTDWTVPVDSNITVNGGNYDFGSLLAPMSQTFAQEVVISDKTKMEARLTVINGTTPAGFGFETSLRVIGGDGLGFAIYGEDDASVDAFPTKTFYIETGNKTAGTGNSGDIYLTTGTSVGGSRGSVIINAGGMSLSNGNIIDLANPVDVADAVNLGFLNTQLATKENSFGAGTISQYLRGDKTFQTLNTTVVPEGTNLYYLEGRFDTSFSGKTTTNLSEGSNLYFTDERVDDRASALIQNGTGIAWTYDDGLNTLTGNISLSGFSTTDLTEGTNLYYTNTRADSRITLQRGAVNGLASLDGNGKIPSGQIPAIALTDVYTAASEISQLAITPIQMGDVVIRSDQNKSYIHNGGITGTIVDFNELLTPTDTVLSVNGSTGVVSLSTSDISEGSNLYYTQGRFDTALGLKSTSDLSEGTNLYYTDGRFDTRLSSKSTTNLTEGANLYYTDARVRATVLTGFLSGAGAVSAVDTVLSAINKLDGNVTGKEPTITSGVTTQYWRGDKSFQTLDTSVVAESTNLYYTDTRVSSNADVISNTAKVGFTAGLFDTNFNLKTTNDLTENTNLYFTNVRAISAPITGFSSGAGTLSSSDSILQAIQKLDGNINSGASVTTTQALTNNASATDVTGLIFNKINVKSAFIKIDIERSTDTGLEQFNETGELVVAYKAKTDTWAIYLQSFGDDAGVIFTVTNTGQVQYATTNLTGINYSANLRFTVTKELAQ